MRYYEVFFKITPKTQDACDILISIVADAGFESFVDVEDGVKGYAQVDLLNRDYLDGALQQFPFSRVSITYDIKELEDKDWNEQWETEGFDPIVINNCCIIYDAQRGLPEDMTPQDDSIIVAIQARQAFGTGNHETTRMVAATLLDEDLTGKRLLDCGCGTGILGIIAKKKGAEEVVGYDIDDWSVNNTLHNAELNDVKIEVLEGDKSVLSHINGIFDIVTANINRNILIDDMEAFHSVIAPHGKLILSGFYESDADLLLKEAREYGLREIARKTENDWCCLVLQ